MIKIEKVKALPDYRIECVFENDETVVYDMSYILEQNTPMLNPLRNKEVFNNVFLESGAPVWINGYDLCPDAIWKKAHGQEESQLADGSW